MVPKLIGLAGPARSGKDTVCKILREVIMAPTIRYALADPLKQAVNQLLGWNDAHADGHLKEVVDEHWGISPRRAYQTFGTEWARKYLGEDFWIRKAQEYLEMWLGCTEGLGVLIMSDIRFENEAEWVRKHGVLVHITRDVTTKVAQHQSEDGVKFIEGIDERLDNNHSIESLRHQVRLLVSHLSQ